MVAAAVECKSGIIITVLFMAKGIFLLNNKEKLTAAIEMAANNPYPISIEGYKNQLAALLATNTSDILKDISPPCLVLGGAEDIITPPDENMELANGIPNASYHEFENCGHLPHAEMPDEFHRVVTEFLK